MAILKNFRGEIEVRIKRYPDETYYDEFIKTNRREQENDESHERYIISESGTAFFIEVTLRKGFSGGYEDNCVEAAIILPGHEEPIGSLHFYPPAYPKETEEDKVLRFKDFDVDVDGYTMRDASFSFRELQIGRYLIHYIVWLILIVIDKTSSNETDIMDVLPKHLSTIKVRLKYCGWTVNTLSDLAFSRVKWKRAFATKDSLDPQNTWEARDVNENSFNEHGITSVIWYIQPHFVREILTNMSSFERGDRNEASPRPSRHILETTRGEYIGTVRFLCGSSG